MPRRDGPLPEGRRRARRAAPVPLEHARSGAWCQSDRGRHGRVLRPGLGAWPCGSRKALQVLIDDAYQNPQTGLQAQDRAHRIGQTKPMLIFRLVNLSKNDKSARGRLVVG